MCYPPAAGWSLHPEIGKDGDAEEKSKSLLKSHGLHGAPPEILSTCLQRAIVRPNPRDAPPPTRARARRLVSWRRLRRPHRCGRLHHGVTGGTVRSDTVKIAMS